VREILYLLCDSSHNRFSALRDAVEAQHKTLWPNRGVGVDGFFNHAHSPDNSKVLLKMDGATIIWKDRVAVKNLLDSGVVLAVYTRAEHDADFIPNVYRAEGWHPKPIEER